MSIDPKMRKLVTHLVWDESEQCMVEVNRTSSYKTSNRQISSGNVEYINTTNVFYHPRERRKYTEDQVETKPLPSFEKKCTCGGKFTSGTHSDWCDINYKEEDELPF